MTVEEFIKKMNPQEIHMEHSEENGYTYIIMDLGDGIELSLGIFDDSNDSNAVCFSIRCDGELLVVDKLSLERIIDAFAEFNKRRSNKVLHEWEIYESDLPWWFFWIFPGDNMIFQHYGSVCYGGYTYEDVPKRYRKYAKHIYQRY